jgi:hypothetical protein
MLFILMLRRFPFPVQGTVLKTPGKRYGVNFWFGFLLKGMRSCQKPNPELHQNKISAFNYIDGYI